MPYEAVPHYSDQEGEACTIERRSIWTVGHVELFDVSPTSRSDVIQRMLRRCAVFALLLSFAVACLSIASKLINNGGAEIPQGKLTSVVSDVSVLEMGIEAYKTMGGFDPFTFACPLPFGFAGAAQTVPECCQAYDKLAWPYVFPECTPYSNCSTCFRSSSVLSKHVVAPLAGAAWSAVVAVESHESPTIGAEVEGYMQDVVTSDDDVSHASLEGGRMRGKVREGLLQHGAVLCPAISDWTATLLSDDDDNVQARVYKSASAKLAVVAFRGTRATSLQNWAVDADIDTVKIKLGKGANASTALVHEGFYAALLRILPRVKRWVTGYMLHIFGAVPHDWKLVFTGHSLGGALALLAATEAEAKGWSRTPDATIIFGAPRVADASLDAWWQAQGLCAKLLRVNVYDDVIHWMPFLTAWSSSQMLDGFMSCLSDPDSCLSKGSLTGGSNAGVQISDSWKHVCSSSEFFIPGAARGINEHFTDLSPVGGVLSHVSDQCFFGYTYGSYHGGIFASDGHCGLQDATVVTDICKSFQALSSTSVTP